MLADSRAVSNLREVIDLYATRDAGFAHTGTIDAGVGLHLHIALENGWAGLSDLLPVISVAGETEAVAADDRSVLQNDVVAELAVLPNNGMSVGKEVIADARSAVDDNMRQEHCVVAGGNVVVNYDIRADMSIGADFRRSSYHRRGMNPLGVARRLIEQIDGPRKGEVWVLAAQHGARRGREVLGDNDG